MVLWLLLRFKKEKTMNDITIQTLWQLLQPSELFGTRGRYQKCLNTWCRLDAAQQKRIYQQIAEKKRRGEFVHPNPCFALDDALQTDELQQARQPKAEPTNYNGRALPKEPVATAFYNGKWGTYTMRDIKKFGLQTKDR